MTRTALEGIMLNEIRQRKAEPYDLTYTWDPRNKINVQTKEKQTRRHRRN